VTLTDSPQLSNWIDPLSADEIPGGLPELHVEEKTPVAEPLSRTG
jgi:hypothetical protein